MRNSRVLLAAATCTMLTPIAASAISITESTDAFALANTLFLNLNDSLIVNNATLSGAVGQSGTYTNAAGTYGMPNAGIVLSTGNVSNYETVSNTDFDGEFGEGGEFPEGGEIPVALSLQSIPPSSINNFGDPATPEQVEILQPITGQDTFFDVAQLNVEFFANTTESTVTFFATFGSEEFPNFVGSSFVDGFGLLINGVNVAGVEATNGSGNQPVNINHPDFAPIPGTELNGVLAPGGNPVLQFDVPINPGEVNEFSVIIADASDSAFDSTVYLSSFFAEGSGSATGETEQNPLLPSNPPDPETGAFVIELPLDDPNTEEIEGFANNELFWVDPPVSVGFEYDLTGPGTFSLIQAPSLATVADITGYTINIGGDMIDISAGQLIDVSSYGANSFTLTGIDEALMLDPDDPLAFPLGIAVDGADLSTFLTIDPIEVDFDPGGGNGVVPLPAGGLLYLTGLAIGGFALRRRSRKSES